MQVFDLNYMQRVNDISINDAQHLLDILRSFIDQKHTRTIENIDMIDLFSIVNHAQNARDIDDILMHLSNTNANTHCTRVCVHSLQIVMMRSAMN